MDTYEKKYNEALERARALWREAIEKEYAIDYLKDYETIFPELRESEDERIRKILIEVVNITPASIAVHNKRELLAWLEKQKEIPMPNSTELIEMWHNEEAMLKEKDFRGDTWRIAYNAFLDGFAQGMMVKQKEQKSAEEQDYSGLTDLERAIHRGFLVAGVENVPVTIIKETAKDCLAHMPAEWSEEDKNKMDVIIRLVEQNSGWPDRAIKEYVNWLKSLRPSWKPTEEHLSALLAVFNDPDNIGSQTCQLALTDLYEQLKKL